MQAAQLEGARLSALWKAAALSGSAMLALAFATPAHADDQPPAPTLMLARTAVIAPDEPDATVPPDAAAPAPDSAPTPDPDPVPIHPVAVAGWKLAEKPNVAHRAPPVRVQAVTPPPVISAGPAQVHASPAQRAVKRVRSATTPPPAPWYQVPKLQYRDLLAVGHGGLPSLAVEHAQRPPPAYAVLPHAPPQRARTICELRLRKCLQFCGWIATDNTLQNERRIGTCISAPDPASRLDRVHELLLDRLWSVARDGRGATLGRQYQSFEAQYQSARASFGWELVGAETRSRPRARPIHTVAWPVVHFGPSGHAHVLAAVATPRTHAQAQRTVAIPSESKREVEVEPTARSRASTDWLLRSLVVLIGFATLALLLAAGSVLPRPGNVLSGMRTRLGSRGLSSSRLDLGHKSATAPPRGRGIPYRD